MERLLEKPFALVIAILALLAPALALAADGGVADSGAAAAVVATATASTTVWWEVLLAHLLEATVAIAVPVLSTLAVVLLKRWNIKLKYETVYDLALKGAGWAEQQALKRLKDGVVTPSAQKLDDALRFARDIAEQQKLPKKATDKLQDLIESALGAEKLKEPGELIVGVADPVDDEDDA